MLKSFDPNGNGTSGRSATTGSARALARFGEPGPKYVAYIDPGPPDKRVIVQHNHQLDIIHDTSPEGMFTLVKQSPTRTAGSRASPIAHPDPTLPAVIFNNQVDKFKNRGRALGAGAADRHQGDRHGLLSRRRHDLGDRRSADRPLSASTTSTRCRPGCKDFEIDTGKQKIKPYDPTVGQQIADMLRPSMGDQIPTDPKADRRQRSAAAGGSRIPQAATELLEKAGFKKEGDKWMQAGRHALHDQAPGRGRPAAGDDPRRHHDRPAMAQVRHRRQDQSTPAGLHLAGSQAGDFEAVDRLERGDLGRSPRPVVLPRQLALGVPEAAGERQPPRNRQRWKNAELDKIIEQIRTIDFDDPKGIELGQEYIKLAVKEMPIIPLMSYNVFTVMDKTYWTGYPSAETDPYTDPVPNWANTKYMMVKLKPTGAKSKLT